MKLEHQSLEGRVAVITGAGQGIGRAYAHAFGAAGAIPVIADLRADRADIVRDEITRTGARALAVPVDVSNFESVSEMVERVVGELGRIDVLVNNAGIYVNQLPPAERMIKRPFDEIPLDEWDQFLKVNITGSYYCVRAVAPIMRRANYGRIINTSSTTVLLGIVGQLHYVTSKAALIGMTRSLARELGVHGITVNTLMPGLIQTEVENPQAATAKVVAMQCIQRSEVPDDLVPAVLFLASEGARFITGQTINVDGGSVFV